MQVQTQRLFVCVDPSPAAVVHLGAVVDDLEVSRAGARLTARDRWHVTLAFLGDARVDRIDATAAALDRAWARTGPVTVRFAGGGTFGRGAFAILWAGLGGDVNGLVALSLAVRRDLRRARVHFDPKPFRPHLTISRPGSRLDPAAVAQDVTTLSTYEGPEWTVVDMHLMASELGPSPVYTRLHTTS